MQLVLTEEQELVAKTASDFFDERSPVSRMRELRDKEDPVGFSRELWKEMAELGWLGIPFPEEYGGAEMGLAELSTVLEAAGRKLAPEPFLSSVLLGGQALLQGGSDSQKAEWLPRLLEGEALLSLAFQEARSGYSLSRIETTAARTDAGWRLTGEKIQVLDGHVADALLVSAHSAGEAGGADGISLFLVPADAPGLGVARQSRIDSRGAALVTLDGVELSDSALVGDVGGSASLLERVVDRATVGLCAEMLGGTLEAFDLTLAYMKEREQFGARIGSFQALQHRMARLYMEIELCRSAVMGAARALDEGAEDGRELTSLAKARCSETFVLAGNEGVQIFGGVGMTDEYDIGLYLKRARAAELSLGDAPWHRRRWAELQGY